MWVDFVKYQATGNDFIIIDAREQAFYPDIDTVTRLCHRKFGIGSDGLMLLKESAEADFEMIFFNPDGSRSLCGNGSRAAVAHAARLGLHSGTCSFITTDGLHQGRVEEDGKISIDMHPVQVLVQKGEDWLINTGSPHFIRYVANADAVDVHAEGAKIRYADEYAAAGGVNVNFVQHLPTHLKIRTYERGVEAETLSCGTGVTAAVLSAARLGYCQSHCPVETAGGTLEVSFEATGKGFENIWLKGPALEVFQGKIEI